jgi:hypothetical protein
MKRKSYFVCTRTDTQQVLSRRHDEIFAKPRGTVLQCLDATASLLETTTGVSWWRNYSVYGIGRISTMFRRAIWSQSTVSACASFVQMDRASSCSDNGSWNFLTNWPAISSPRKAALLKSQFSVNVDAPSRENREWGPKSRILYDKVHT